MTDYVQIPPDSTGKLIDAPSVVNESGATVQRERIIVAELAAAIAAQIRPLQQSPSVDFSTGRVRVTIDGASSSATVAIGNVATLSGTTIFDAATFHIIRQNWALNIGTRIT